MNNQFDTGHDCFIVLGTSVFYTLSKTSIYLPHIYDFIVNNQFDTEDDCFTVPGTSVLFIH